MNLFLLKFIIWLSIWFGYIVIVFGFTSHKFIKTIYTSPSYISFYKSKRWFLSSIFVEIRTYDTDLDYSTQIYGPFKSLKEAEFFMLLQQ